MPDDYGFGNKVDALESVRRFCTDAVADGWAVKPTYNSEPVDSAFTLDRDGFKVMGFARDHGAQARKRYETSISGWGPDGLAIKLPNTYDWSAIASAVRTCGRCGATVDRTFRFSFAGRSCSACLPAARAECEKPGWDN